MTTRELFRRSFCITACILMVISFFVILCHQAFASDDGWITAADNPYNWDPSAESEAEPEPEPEAAIKIVLPDMPEPTIGESTPEAEAASASEPAPEAPSGPDKPPIEPQPPPELPAPEGKTEDKPGRPEPPIVFKLVTIGASRKEPAQPVQLTLGHSSMDAAADDVTAIRRNFDFVLYILLPLISAVIIFVFGIRWFSRTFLNVWR